MVVRDGAGDVLMIAGQRIEEGMTALQAEARATFFGLKYAYDAGYRNVEFESDCLHLIELVTQAKKENLSAQMVVNDMRELAKIFDYCVLNFASRSCNNVAHTIAATSLTFEDVVVWLEECPDFVSHLVQTDKGLS